MAMGSLFVRVWKRISLVRDVRTCTQLSILSMEITNTTLIYYTENL